MEIKTQPSADTVSEEEQMPTRRSRRVIPMQEVQVTSPDGQLAFTVGPNPERLTYWVTMDGRIVTEPSAFHMILDGYHLSSGVIFNRMERYTVDEAYPWHGAHDAAVHRCNGLRLSLTHDLSMITYVLDIRVFDDGFAYRHIIEAEPEEAHVPDEGSQFILPAGTVCWYHDLDGHYEAEYAEQEISNIQSGQWGAPPLTFRLPGNAGYGSITEANLVNYSGMALENDGRRGWTVALAHRHPINYPFELRYGREEAKRLASPAAVYGKVTTPWRVMMLARDLNGLVNCDIVHNLSPAADPKLFPEQVKTAWVEPGLAVWDYVDRKYEPREGIDAYELMKKFSLMGHQLGAKYHILEGFAYQWPDEQIREFVEYSKDLGIRVMFWRHSKDLRTAESRESFFSRLHRLGVAGAKIDFFDHEAKENIDLYEELLRMAAERQLVLNFHGSNKPTGRTRTWPNAMIYEGIRGMESSGLKKRARHETILPFTRYLAGPADYTTMIFTERRRDSTWAHQIACLATFHSPMLTIAAHPQSVLDNPALAVIRNIKPVWDETIVLPESSIGELTLFARRSGGMWILAVMSAGPARAVQVPLSFLAEGTYQATLVRDDLENDGAVVLEERMAERSQTLAIELHSGGGFVGMFIKQANV
ncbi:glycoside hydrolase family 97 catalytic domain-containing protein [Paenibacillus sp. GD4]|jgi:alpha-glucosidase|uniref:glycoside hydrolase family 97 protein n=1 Tax=Paenibacillus sp. GD4 TaxID=3068890 RepID=UPI002796C7A4|nr:glycoside hydrolase family 97 protein [Paenibacillus sp. GD4]MDQ1912597.1 glycoside hydrolase family 97 catalytic domain-containing protein [Paenibacillus sp. GD4]